MADSENEMYQLLLKEFAAKKLPEFYQKYSRDQSNFDYGSFSAQYKASDLFPQTLPVERFLDIPGPIRKRKFFEDISVGHIMEGIVVDKWADTLHIRLLSVYYGPKRWINDLRIKGECDLSEFKTHSGSRRLSDSISDFDIGDHVRGVISFVDRKDWKLTISFRRSLLPDSLSHTELGAIEEERNLILDEGVNDDEDDNRGGYLYHLRSSPCFQNPGLTSNLLRHLGIDTEKPCTFLDSLTSEVDPDEYGEKLRERQSTKWSLDMVANGVKLFKESKHEEALRCFDQALQMHPKNVEALVARGALNANQNLFKSAIADFREALEIHPSHRNGRKYLCETLMTVAKQYEKDRLWKDASRCYKETLEINPNHEEAKERTHHIRIILSQQVLAGKRKAIPDQGSTVKTVNVAAGSAGSAGSVGSAGKESSLKSKSLIELLKKKVSKKAKKKKRKKSKSRKRAAKKRKSRHSDSSPTDSCDDSEVTESASENPTSESDDEWIEKPAVDDKTSNVQRRDVNSQSLLRQQSIEKQRREAVGLEASFGANNARNEEEEASSHVEYKKARKASGKVESDSRNDEKVFRHKDSAKRKEYEKMSRKRSTDEKTYEQNTRKKREEREQKQGNRRGSTECSMDETSRNRPSEGIEALASVAPSKTFPGDNFSHTHFSNDEISFINSMFSENSNK